MKTPRERVITALQHKEPDRVPVDLGGHESSGIHCLALKRLLRYLGLDEEVRICDPIQLLGEVPESLLKKFNVDVINIGRTISPTGLTENDVKFKEYRLLNETFYIPEDIDIFVGEDGRDYMRAWFATDPEKRKTVVAVRPPSTLFFEPYPFYTPLKDVKSASEIKELPLHPWLTEYSKEQLDLLRKNAKWLYENTDYALLGRGFASLFEITIYLLGHVTWAKCLRSNRGVIERLVDLLLEHNKEQLKKFLNAVGEYVQIVVFGGEDLGSQIGPNINPKDWRELYKPALKELVDLIKKSGCYALIHSCGSIKPFIEDFIEIGIDAMNPVQISARNMDPRELKREFGDEITFWGGGCDTQHVLPHATPEKVKQHVKELVTVFKEGGGFIFCQVHNIEADVPPENIIAMYEAVNEAGAY